MSLYDDWTRSRERLLPAIAQTDGRHTEDSVLCGILVGAYKLWFTDKSACVTEVVKYPQFNVFNVFLVGGDLDDILAHEPEFVALGRAQSCKQIEMGGRMGWAKKLTDYRNRGVVLTKDI